MTLHEVGKAKVDVRALIKFWRESLTELERHEDDRDERLRLAEAVCEEWAKGAAHSEPGAIEKAFSRWVNAAHPVTPERVHAIFSAGPREMFATESDEDYARRMGWKERGRVWRRQKRSKGYWPFIEHRQWLDYWRLVPTADIPITEHPTLRAAVDAYAAQAND